MSTSVLERPQVIPPGSSGEPIREKAHTGAWVDHFAVGIIIGAWAIGIYFRLWFVFHVPINSDQSVVGLIAQGGLHGHFTAFFGGQAYGGTAETYLASIAFAVFGQSGIVESTVVGVLAAVAALMTVRVARRMVPARLAQLIGALAFVGPAVTLRDSVRITGFRGVALICGLGLLLVSLRLLDGDRRIRNFVVLGALLGIGWWSTPEIAYFVLPAGMIILGAAVRGKDAAFWTRGFLVAVVSAIPTSLPWIWANVNSKFASVSPGPAYFGTYSQRLENFFRFTIPMQAGLILPDSGAHILGWFYWPALVVISAVILAAIGLCLAKGGRAAAVGATLLLFPFVYSIPPQTGAWMDGRYAVYIAPLLALALGIAAGEAARRLRMLDAAATLLMSIVVACVATLCIAGVFQLLTAESDLYVHHWGNPDAATLGAIAKLEHDGITTGYADYWAAYKLDFLSRGHLTITVGGYDDDRSLSIDAMVLKSKHPAWLFVPSTVAWLDGTQFTAPALTVGPDNGEVDQSQFIELLRRRHVGYRVFNAGIINAVVPDRAFTPYELGMPGALPGLA